MIQSVMQPMNLSAFPNSVICLLVAFLSLAAQEVPSNKMFFPCAWCKDFTIGARGAGVKNESGYELWMHIPEMGNKEYRIAATHFPGSKGSTHDLFLAVLQERLDHPGREADRADLERETHALFQGYPKADGKNASRPLLKPDVRAVIEQQREDLFRASLKTGTAATSK